MKRNSGLVLIAIFVIGLTFLLLPTSLAKRDDSGERVNRTFTATPAIPIPDNMYVGGFNVASQACSTIDTTSSLPPGTLLSSVDVTIAITHTWVGDLTIKLRSPAGSILGIASRPGVVETADDGNDTAGVGDSSNLLSSSPITFIDSATATAETMGSVPPLTSAQTICVDGGSPCQYQPAPGSVTSPPANFAAFSGQLAVGNWTMCIGDGAAADLGTFQSWTLRLSSPTAAPAMISGKITTADGAPLGGVTMNLGGARSAKVITDSNGNYRFVNVDTDNFYTVTPRLVNYHFGPESRSFSLLANMTDATFTATLDAVISGNAIDTADFFVRQHYLDFLGREPDSAGLNFWSDQILSCGNDFNCIERRTINVSAAYFLSIEFRETGGFVDGLYRASYGRAPLFSEFMPDTATVARDVIVNETGWQEQLLTNKQEFLDAWVQRPAFRATYDNLANDSYVDTLISHTDVSFTDGERAALVSGLTDGTLTRTQVLQRVAQNERFAKAKFNEAFVRMQYFGYLRRDPDDSGFQFWLNKLNQFGGNFEQAEMVKAFLVSGEYRDRFRQ